MSKLCITCGVELQDSWLHCSNCGTKVFKEPEGKNKIVIADPAKVPIQAETNTIYTPINTGKKSYNTTTSIVAGIILLALILFFTTKSNSDNSFSPSSDFQSSDTTDISQSDFPLTIDKMPSDLESNGTFCQSILGQGWYCTVELRVVNSTSAPWNGTMIANLVTNQGVISEGSISTEVNYLTSTFGSKVNPGQGYRWSTYFEVGPNLRFQFVQILDNGKTISTIPVCIGSSDNDALGC